MKKFFFLALMAFLWLPATTWADNEIGDEGTDDEQENYDDEGHGSIVNESVPLVYKIITPATGQSEEEAGEVELEGVSSTYSGNTGALSIPHIIHNLVLEGTTASVYYYKVVGIAMGAFGAMSNTNADQTITNITIPYTVTYLGEDEVTGTTTGCFTRCANLTSVTFAESTSTPSQLETIGTSAFQNCTGLKSIDIPSSVETIGSSAFQSCSGLTSINFPSESQLTTISQNAFQDCTALTEVAIPSGVTSLSNSEFYRCTSLKTVWMPGSIQLQGNVFRGCTSLSAIVLEGEPGENGGTESSEVFNDDNGEAITLYVEKGLAPAYLASAWEQDVENESSSNAVLSWNFLTYSDGINSLSCDEDGTYYATYYTDAVGEFGDDVTPYIVTGIESGEITTQKLDGYIPAGTGVLLTASNYGDTYYYHPYGVDENSDGIATTTGNMLYGSIEGGTTTEPATSGYYYYKLTLNSDSDAYSVGFYWGATDGGAFSSGAYKAYLSVPTTEATGLSYFSFKNDEGDTTGISAVESASEAKTVKGIYTLQGVRVSDMSQKGVYIVDGKKVLVK